MRATFPRFWAALLGAASLFLSPQTSFAQLQFVEAGDRGISPSVMENGKGGGVVAADFDGDGDVDLFVPNAEGVADQLYRNLGDGHFEEIAAIAGLASMDRSRVALFFDYDGDNLLDLITASDCWEAADTCPDTSSLRLYRQVSDAQFVDVTLSTNLPDDAIFDTVSHRGGIAAGDLDGDGDLDLVLSLWGGHVRIFRNDNGSTFTETTIGSGLDIFAFYWQPILHDFNGDGRLDIYQSTDAAPNSLWINQGDGTFVDQAEASGTDSAWNDMGVCLGDYDNDGDFDLYVTNIKTPSRHNILLRNDSTEGSLLFTSVEKAAGVEDGGWGWGCTFLDADNDGNLDLAATNGYFDGDHATDTSKLFHHLGDATSSFDDVSTAAGFDDTQWGSALVAADFDRDGDLDLVQSCNGSGPQSHQIRLLDNVASTSHHYLVVKPRMPGANQRAIGAVVRAKVGNAWKIRHISAGTSFYGQEPAEAFFGLGEATTVDVVRIDWPDGTSSEVYGVAADQVLEIPSSWIFADGFESGDLTQWSAALP